jgi:hypothetical protein
MRPLALGCLALAGLSLLIAAPPGADAWAWLIWGREIVHGSLDTTGGPSWKPLGVLGTAPISLLGRAAPEAWLVVVRAGGLLALALASRIALRLTPPALGRGGRIVAAGVAALGLALVPAWASAMAQGYSEPLVAAALLGAVERELAGARTAAIVLAWVVGLARPEAWPFLGLYAVWVWRRDPGRRALVLALAASLPLLWFVPDWIGAGDPFYGGRRARSGGTVGWDASTLEAAIRRAVAAAPWPLLALAGVGVAAGGPHRAQRRVLALLAVAWATLVLAMTLGGYLAIERFFLPPAALACALAGAGAGLLAARAAWGAAAVAAAVSVLGALRIPEVPRQLDGLGLVADLQDGLRPAIARAGGRRAVLATGRVVTRAPGTDRPLAWELDVPLFVVRLRRTGAAPGAVVFSARGRSWEVSDPARGRRSATAG